MFATVILCDYPENYTQVIREKQFTGHWHFAHNRETLTHHLRTQDMKH